MRPAVLAPLTSFRFIAAMAIVVFHTTAPHQYYLRSGVTFFYVLSGFILIYVHPRVEGVLARYRFWVSRFARIWPLHLFTLLAAVLYFHGGDLRLFLLDLFLLQAWVPSEQALFSYNGVAWSLSVELFFYFAFPFVLPWVHKAPARTLAATVGLTGIVVVALGFIPKAAWGNQISYLDFTIYNPVLNLYKFVLGMVVGKWWMNSSAAPASRTWSLVEAAAFVGVLAFVPLSSTVAGTITGWDTTAAQRQLQDFLCTPFFALLIFIFAYQQGAVSRVLSWKGFVLLGDISFSVYMLQFMFLLFHQAGVGRFSMRWIVYAVCLVSLSWVTYSFIEIPARRWIVAKADPWVKRYCAGR